MTKKNNQERLLEDVLSGEADAGFREAWLAEILRLARNRRRSRQVQRVAALLAVVAVITAVAVWNNPRRPVIIQSPPAQNYQLTLSQPFPRASIVRTRPLTANQLVASTALANLLHTSATSGGYREVDDDELLALAAPRVAALVRHGPHAAELLLIPSVFEAAPGQD